MGLRMTCNIRWRSHLAFRTACNLPVTCLPFWYVWLGRRRAYHLTCNANLSVIFFNIKLFYLILIYLLYTHIVYKYNKVKNLLKLLYDYSTWYTRRVVTRLVHRLLVCWLIRGEARQYIDHVVYLNRIDSHHHLNEHTILYVFRAPGYDLLVLLN